MMRTILEHYMICTWALLQCDRVCLSNWWNKKVQYTPMITESRVYCCIIVSPHKPLSNTCTKTVEALQTQCSSTCIQCSVWLVCNPNALLLVRHPSISVVNVFLKYAILNKNHFTHSTKSKIINMTRGTEQEKIFYLKTLLKRKFVIWKHAKR